MFFKTAGVEVELWIPPLVAFVISFFTSMGGLSGAFLLLPFQMSFLGYTTPSVSATNQLYNIVSIPSGVYRYWREKRMVWPLTWIVITGTLPGVFIGAIIRVAFLPNPKYFKLFVASVLLYVGIKMVKDLVKAHSDKNKKDNSEKKFQDAMRLSRSQTTNQHTHEYKNTSIKITHFNLKRLGYTFLGENFDVSCRGIFSLSLLVGIIGGIYGIGGGAIIAPFFVTFFGLPVYTVAGAALMGTFVTSVAGVIFYQAISFFYPELAVAPDWILGILFGIGGSAGIYLGARFQKFIPAKIIKCMLAVVAILTACKYVSQFFAALN